MSEPVIIGDATLWLGDCLEVLRTLADASVDSIVTDPPYHLTQSSLGGHARTNNPEMPHGRHRIGDKGFMGKVWDGGDIAHRVELWAECLRVLKPGGHLLAFAGTRTYHRMACAIEDAGFELRDQIMWLYGSGFPKSLDVSKAIDRARRRDYVLAAVDLGLEIPGNNLHDWTKAEHAPGDKWWDEFKRVLTPEQWGEIERHVIGTAHRKATGRMAQGEGGYAFGENFEITSAATDAARQWSGWGTALKPAHEPICVARKPLVGTVAANVLEHGTGALNIDACRVPTTAGDDIFAKNPRTKGGFGHAGAAVYGDSAGAPAYDPSAGRWPANVIHDGSREVLEAFPDAPGQMADVSYQDGARKTQNVYGATNRGHEPSADRVYADNGGTNFAMKPGARRLDTGSAARFFYCAKASRADRNEGVGGNDEPSVETNATMRDCETAEWQERNGNFHPTVKPTDLMAYLCRLVTPPNGLVLDPFMGSGSTGKAAMREGFRFVGIDMTPEYVEIARARIEYEQTRRELAIAEAAEAARQTDLFAESA